MLEEKNKDIQKLYSEFQLIDNQIKMLQQQISTLNAQLHELVSTTKNLDDLKNVKPGTEIFVPINSGVYAKAEIKDNNELIVNVGANTVVNKNVEDTKKTIETQINELKNLQTQMVDELNQMTNQAALLENQINNLASKNV